MNDKLTPETISEYYEKKFPMKKFMSFIGLSEFKNREFGFVVGNNRFIRNLSFQNTDHLREFMVENSVKDAYVGAVFDQPPSRENPIQKIKWKFRELIFDLDIDEYDAYVDGGEKGEKQYVGVRSCGCRDDEYCDECWSLIQDAAIFIDQTMKEDFGYKNITWIFSGRRGVHGWVREKEPIEFDRNQRRAILDYLTFIHDPTRTQSIEDIPSEAKPLRNRIYSLIAKSYLVRSTAKELNEFGISLNKAREIIKEVKAREEFDHNRYNILIPDNKQVRKKLSSEIIRKRYPRIDRKVTMDTNRVSRMPYSVHGKTGQIAIIIKDLRKFYPVSTPTIWDSLK
ncbi:MAG: DNA primase catalytic subunit PriS [Candidatus Heimdallarchaeota archaeon]|nr:DNA primase catalytic subunit PriS [Candidatus Heimdallarchaeota archaeon]MCK4955360.1 DNA primase catalytic subunit PriS [Candidatus Heimdallarchaeota archaeon]